MQRGPAGVIYQTNAAKESMKVQLHTESGVYIESYVYAPGFFRFNWHSSYELLTVLCGAVNVYHDGQVQRLEEEDVILIHPQQGHATIAAAPGTRLLLLHLLPESLWPDGAQPRFVCCSTPRTRGTAPFVQLRHYMARLYEGLADGDAAGRCDALGVQYCLGALLLRHFVQESGCRAAAPDAKQTQRLKAIFAYTDEHYTRPIRMEALAARLGLNAAYLSALFHEQLGISYSEYLARKRLQQAIHLLNNTDLSLTRIAEAVGFPSVRALNTAFQRYFDITIPRYRQATAVAGDDSYKAQFPQYFDRSDPQVAAALQRCLTAFTNP